VLLRNRFFGRYVRNYLEGRGMSLKMKIWTLAALWAAMVCTTVLVTNSLLVRVTLATVLAGVTVHILLLKTATNSARPSKGSGP
jgi:uncharacterized membrane protein YbaN (DUF454 family)